MFDTSDHTPPHLGPIDTRIHVLVQQATDGNILAPNQVQAMFDLGGGFVVIAIAYDALERVL